MGGKKNCSGGDSNPHALRHAPLKRTCLPFHHPSFLTKEGRENEPLANIPQAVSETFCVVFPQLTGANEISGRTAWREAVT